MTRTIELSGAPSLGPLFFRALVRTPGRRGGSELPDLLVRRSGAQVDRDQLAGYADVCGFDLGDVLPASYLHLLVFPLQTTVMADAAFPFPLVGSVHLSNSIVSHRPVDAGEVMQLEVHAANLRSHFRGAQVDLLAVVTVDGEIVWQERSTYLFRGWTVPGEVPPKGPERDPLTAAGSIWRVPADIGRRYAGVSGDANPIHLHPLGAKALGFPTTIAHGMWSVSRALAALENRVPSTFTYDVDFKKPVLVPATLSFVAEEHGSSWDLALTDARKGTLHMVGSIRPGAGGHDFRIDEALR